MRPRHPASQHDALLAPLTAFRTPDAPRLLTRSMSGGALALTEVSGPANHGLTASIPPSRGYLVQLRLRDCADATYFAAGRALDTPDRRAGAIQLHDLRQDPRVELVSPFHVVHMNVQLAVLEEVAAEGGSARIDALHTRPGQCHRDPVIEHLLRAMRPALARPNEASALFLDQVSTALCLHLARQFAGTRPQPHPRGGLAPWQERAAKELLHGDPAQDIGLARLAQACGLSVRHFTRAFRQSVGMSPHQYRLRCRIDAARALLRANRLPIGAIAIDCGFASQSHFTRCFHAALGLTPGEWRRRHGDIPFVSIAPGRPDATGGAA